MTVWERYSSEQREAYINYLKMYGALSAMFNQKSSETGAPYLDSKFQETIYARSFNSEDVDIGNTPHDIRSTFGNDKIGIGIKTWLSSKPSYQKVMQLKRYKDEINPYISETTKDELAYVISKIKNDRLITDYKRLGLKDDSNIYHYVTRDKGCLNLSETSYPLVDMEKLKPGKLVKSSFTFTDGNKEYRYTFGDSQIWMRFGEGESDTYSLAKININILKDPFAFLSNAFKNYKENNGIYVPESSLQRDYLYLPLYSYRSKEVPESSGLNAWNGKPKSKGSTTVRPEGEAYIPIPKALWKKCPHWVDPNVDMSEYEEYKQTTGKSSYPINLHMPDGQVFQALFTQSGFKSLQTDPQNILGKWILNVLGIKKPKRERYDKPATDVVTMKRLQQLGYDSLKLWHEDPDNPKDIWIDFAEYGSFERFMKNEMQVTEEDDNN